MRYTFEEEFRLDHPETAGEKDRHFDFNNYKDWLEAQLIEARKQLALYNVVGRSEQCNHVFQRVERGGEFQGNQCECGEWEDLT